MSERFFVLGSNSFSGASFVAAALQAGAEVVGASRSPEPALPFLPYRFQDLDSRPDDAGSLSTSESGKTARAGNTSKALSRFRFEQLDLNSDTDRIAAAIREFQPDYVVNFAAQSMVAESWLYPEHWYQTNIVANVRLFEALRKMNLRKYVHISTPEVYGSCSGTVTESAPFNPSTPYAASRAGCDFHLLCLFKNYGFPVVFTRAANVYGPGQQLYRIIPRTILFLKTGRKLQLHGGGRSVRSFIHIRDVADGALRVARQAPAGEVYHFSTGLYVSIRELVEKICARLGADFDKAVEVVGDRPGKDAAYLLDSAKARTTLGWSDQISLDEGLDETIQWVEEHLEVLQQQPLDYVHKA
jgi:dTDP-glucose 4,6-dehydratase